LDDYLFELQLTGGKPPFIWTMPAGNLPLKMIVTPGGKLTGIPIKSGQFSLDVKVTDALLRSDTRNLSLAINKPPAPQITTVSPLEDRNVGRDNPQVFEAIGGWAKGDLLPDYYWWTNPLDLPPGMILTPGGRLEGIPLKSGTFHFLLNVQDVLQRKDSQSMTMTVNEGLLGFDVFPIEVTEGISTGLVKLASYTGEVPPNPTIDWGDSSTPVPEPGLLHCRKIIPNWFKEREWSGKFEVCEILGSHIYETAGDYTITIERDAGDSVASSATVTAFPADAFVIVSIGDSVASGEGNPVIPSVRTSDVSTHLHEGYWDSLNWWKRDSDGNPTVLLDDPPSFSCHRSTSAGPARAARKIQDDNPDWNVVFMHLACSGAKIKDMKGQLKHAERYLPEGQNIDALMVSVGANNVAGGFGSVVDSCLFGNCLTDEELGRNIDASMDGLANNVDVAWCENNELGCSTECSLKSFSCEANCDDNDIACLEDCSDELSSCNTKCNNQLTDCMEHSSYFYLNELIEGYTAGVTDVYLTEYFDPTGDLFGRYPRFKVQAKCTPILMPELEWEFLHNEMVCGLNYAGHDAATEFEFNYVGERPTPCTVPGGECRLPLSWGCRSGKGGIARAFRKHGYCVVQPFSYVVKIGESAFKQGERLDKNFQGVAHPDNKGHWVYGRKLAESITGVVAELLDISTVEPSLVEPGKTTLVTINGTGFDPGAIVSLTGGDGPEPSVVVENILDFQIDLQVTIEDRYSDDADYWDISVVNPDNDIAVLEAGLGVAGQLKITSERNLPSANAGENYSYSLSASGGSPGYLWSEVPESPMPEWLELSATGNLSGVPPNKGKANFSARVTDGFGNSDEMEFHLNIKK
jgi:hypothetical protein